MKLKKEMEKVGNTDEISEELKLRIKENQERKNRGPDIRLQVFRGSLPQALSGPNSFMEDICL